MVLVGVIAVLVQRPDHRVQFFRAGETGFRGESRRFWFIEMDTARLTFASAEKFAGHKHRYRHGRG